MEQIIVVYTQIKVRDTEIYLPAFHKDLYLVHSDGSVDLFRGDTGPRPDMPQDPLNWRLHSRSGFSALEIREALSRGVGYEVIAQGRNLDAEFRAIEQEMSAIHARAFPYNPFYRNSNWLVDRVLLAAGLPLPQNDNLGEFISPGSVTKYNGQYTLDHYGIAPSFGIGLVPEGPVNSAAGFVLAIGGAVIESLVAIAVAPLAVLADALYYLGNGPVRSAASGLNVTEYYGNGGIKTYSNGNGSIVKLAEKSYYTQEMLEHYGTEFRDSQNQLIGGTAFGGGLRMLGDALGLDGQFGIQGSFAHDGEGIAGSSGSNRSSSHHDDDKPASSRGQHILGKVENKSTSVPKRPVLLDLDLDLDGDGIKITELDRSTVYMDSEGTGLKNRTAWAGAGDGVLFYDADGDGTISDDREYVFTEWDPTASDDLAALRSRFDTNGDGKLSGAELNNFKVMVTNADGSRTVQTAAALGITEIRLAADTTQIAFEDGSAITGQATFVQSGTTKVLGNVTLATEANAHRVVESVTTSGGNRTVTQTGYDSAGDVVFVTTSTTNAAGTSITNRYDDNGDGVVDRFQTIVVTAGGAGQKIETETNYVGTSAAGVLSSREVETTSADGKTVTFERDPTGGGWFSAREVRVTNADGSRSETLSRLVPDGTAVETTTVTISANGLVRTVLTDLKADAAVDHRVTEAVTVAGDGGLRAAEPVHLRARLIRKNRFSESIVSVGRTLAACVLFGLPAQLAVGQSSCEAVVPIVPPPPPEWLIEYYLNFDRRVSAAFPIGSEESLLLDWLRRSGFSEPETSYLDSPFSEEDDEVDRADARMRVGQVVSLSFFMDASFCGRSYFSVGWRVNECGQIVEIYPDTKICHFDIP